MLLLQLLLSCTLGAQSNLPVWPDDFAWSSSGRLSGYDCIRVNEPAAMRKNLPKTAPNGNTKLANSWRGTWWDNYFCWKLGTKNPGIKWSSSGKISGMRCTQITEPAEGRSWTDNYLCVPHSSPLQFSWTSSGITRGKACIKWRERADGDGWDDNFLCAPKVGKLRDPVFPSDFKWSSKAIPPGYDCERIHEAKGGKTWRDNYFCWKHETKDPGIKWSSSGKISGMRCTKITEPKSKGWKDNYLCVPKSSSLYFSWTSRGPPTRVVGQARGKTCIQWRETADGDGWDDNYLCTLEAVNLPDPVFPGDFKWKSSYHPSGYDCVKIYEPNSHSKWRRDSQWRRNYFCWRHGTKNPGIQWSNAGKISGMRCTQITEPAQRSWKDNYLCVPHSSSLRFSWTSSGKIRGKTCMKWLVGSKSGVWADNFLCTKRVGKLRDPVFPSDFKWSTRGIPSGYDCEMINEPKGSRSWRKKNYFCWKKETKDPGIQWSSSGKIKGMRCTRITEPAESRSWTDNYLCVPRSSSLRFSWTSSGKTKGRTCINWRVGSKRGKWSDNYLCLK